MKDTQVMISKINADVHVYVNVNMNVNFNVNLKVNSNICDICKYAYTNVEVLRPSQPNGVMSSAVSLPNHTFIGQA